MPARLSRPHRTPAWAGLLLAGLLVLAQGWGLWHRVAHGAAGAARAQPSASAVALAGTSADEATSAPGDVWFGHAAGAHGGRDCLWFDHLACGDGAPAAPSLPAAAAALPDAALPLAVAAPVPGPRAAFQARAPPGGWGIA